jgi:hypothetical protein
MAKKKATQDWRRPGARVNLYFPDKADLRRLDKLAVAAGVSRSTYVLRVLTTPAA